MTEKIIVSVPHTGTRFIQERLGINARTHTRNTTWEKLLENIGSKKIVTPLRSPLANWVSTSKRINDLSIYHISEWYDSWYRLYALSLIKPIDFICLEDQSDKRITDWTPVGHDERLEFNHPVPTLDFLYDLPLVKRYYSLKKDKQKWWREDAQWMK